MGLFSFWKAKNEIEYYPGGRILNVHLRWNKDTGKIRYYGIYGTRASFNINDVKLIEWNRLNEKQAILILKGDDSVVATFDILPVRVSHNMKQWIESGGTIAAVYDENANEPIPEIDIDREMKVTNTPLLSDEAMDALRKLKELRDLEILTEEEFQAKKKAILDSIV